MKDELTMLKEWIAEQRFNYTIHNFETDEKKLDEITRQQTLLEVQMQILIFEKQCTDAFIDKLISEAKIQPVTTNDTPEEYMHVNPDLRKHLDEVFGFRAKGKE